MSAYVYVRVELQHLSLDLGRLSNLSVTCRLFSACLGGGRPPSCVPLGTRAASRGRPGDRERARTLELRPAEAGTARRGVRAERHLGAAGGPAPPLPSRRFCSFTSSSWKYLSTWPHQPGLRSRLWMFAKLIEKARKDFHHSFDLCFANYERN